MCLLRLRRKTGPRVGAKFTVFTIAVADAKRARFNRADRELNLLPRTHKTSYPALSSSHLPFLQPQLHPRSTKLLLSFLSLPTISFSDCGSWTSKVSSMNLRPMTTAGDRRCGKGRTGNEKESEEKENDENTKTGKESRT